MHGANVSDVRAGASSYAEVTAAGGRGGGAASRSENRATHQKQATAEKEKEQKERRERLEKDRKRREREELEELRAWREKKKEKERAERQARRERREQVRSRVAEGSSDEGERERERDRRPRERDEPRRLAPSDHVRDRSVRSARSNDDDDSEWEYVSHRRRKKP